MSLRMRMNYRLSCRDVRLVSENTITTTVQHAIKLGVAFLTLLSACTPMGPYHGNTKRQSSIGGGDNYSLAYIEFGEQGSYQDNSQLDKALGLIRDTQRPLVVSYIHGWHNNAESNDVSRFSSFLAELSRSESVRHSKYHVIGVYLGWRGEISKFPGISELTFWSRKAAAERLASNFDCYDAIAAISETARKYHKEQYTILFGHSFGGLVVERSVAHAINAEMHGHANSEKSLPADLILLLNPASDSILTRQMIAALYSRHLEDTHQFVVSLTSTGDNATKSWFAVGTTLAAASKHFDKVVVPGRKDATTGQLEKQSEKLFYTSTPGHNELLINHETEDMHKEVSDPQGKTAFEVNLSRKLGPEVLDRYVFATPVKQSNPSPLKLWRFKPVGPVDVPYWDVQVNPEIIKDHGDIWNDKAQAMMAAIFRMNFPLPLRPAPAAPSKKAVPKPLAVPRAPKPNLQREPDFRRLY